MKSLVITRKFADIMALLFAASSQDILIINETSPSMVRFIGSDNRFRTLQLSIDEENSASTVLSLTKSDDPESALKLFKDFLEGLSKEVLDTKKEEVAAFEAADLKKIEAELEHKEAMKLKLQEGQETLLADFPKKEVVEVTPAPKKKVTKKKTTKKTTKKSTKKKKK